MSHSGWVVAIHGGAGRVPSAERDPEYGAVAREGLEAALGAAADACRRGDPALDAAVAAVRVLEDCPVFNAGTGSVLNAAGEIEMDAAVMEGTRRGVGAVAGLRCTRNPVRAARAVLGDGRHVLLAGEGAEAFAREAGLEAIDPADLVTDFRRAQLARFEAGQEPGGGTVGAVVRDAAEHLAAATSTGGMMGKLPGRVSDSALVGSGTWADDATCAVSATGHGELFIRAGFAHRVDALLREAGEDLARACARALEEVAALGGSGGCIAVGADGTVVLPFDTPGMPRGVQRHERAPAIAVHPEDSLGRDH